MELLPAGECDNSSECILALGSCCHFLWQHCIVSCSDILSDDIGDILSLPFHTHQFSHLSYLLSFLQFAAVTWLRAASSSRTGSICARWITSACMGRSVAAAESLWREKWSRRWEKPTTLPASPVLPASKSCTCKAASRY